MNGRRVYPDENGWLTQKLEPGDYGCANPVRMQDGAPLADWLKNHYPQWICCVPNGHAGSLFNHQIVEHEDGTVTVSPSILIRDCRGGELWHGFLERGVWRSC